MSDIFFKIPRSKVKKVIIDAIKLAKFVRVDELDCSKSFARKETHKTWEEIFKMGLKDKHSFWSFVIRNDGRIGPTTDIGCRTCSFEIDYFLWIDLDKDKAYDLAKKYKLKQIG